MPSIILNIIIFSLFLIVPFGFIYYASTSSTRKALKLFNAETVKKGYKVEATEVLQSKYVLAIANNHQLMVFGEITDTGISITDVELKSVQKAKVKSTNDKVDKNRISDVSLVLSLKSGGEKAFQLYKADKDGAADSQEAVKKAEHWAKKIEPMIG